MQRRVTVAMLSAALLVATTAGTAHGAPAAAPGELTSQDIATQGVGSPHYRIPALTTSVKGTVIAAYDTRPTLGDLPGNLGVVVRRSTDGGTTWQSQQVVRKEAAPKGFGDPSLLVDRTTGRIFVFYAGSVNQGFFGSATGNDESDPDVLQADYSYSDDDGVTWTHRRITKQIKNPAWAYMFAASGEGIQVRHGAYKGRLIQQYAIRNNGANYAVSAYSDDHGATWKTGNPVGPGGDENKTVELGDGRIMLNNRSAPYRTVAYSSDGGVTYTPFTQDTNLRDPANNGSIIRYAPDVPASHPQASWLLFSNTDSTARKNLTVKMSCDNGKTWPIRKVVNPDSAAYSTLTRLPDGRLRAALRARRLPAHHLLLVRPEMARRHLRGHHHHAPGHAEGRDGDGGDRAGRQPDGRHPQRGHARPDRAHAAGRPGRWRSRRSGPVRARTSRSRSRSRRARPAPPN